MLFNPYVNVFLTTRHEYSCFICRWMLSNFTNQLSISQNVILISMSMKVMIKVMVF